MLAQTKTRPVVREHLCSLIAFRNAYVITSLIEHMALAFAS